MEFKLLEFEYYNTGGHCMVGFGTVWVPGEDRTIYTTVNNEGCSFWPVDAYSYELDDVQPFLNLSAMDSSCRGHYYFEVARECMKQYLLRDGENRVPYAWLPDEVQQQVTADYEKWLKEEHGVDDPMYETDGKRLILDEEYAEIIREQNRKRAAEKASAVDAATTKLEVINCLFDFKEAYTNLVEQWVKHMDEVNDVLMDDYPFEKSFDELRVVRWCNNSIACLVEKVV